MGAIDQRGMGTITFTTAVAVARLALGGGASRIEPVEAMPPGRLGAVLPYLEVLFGFRMFLSSGAFAVDLQT